MITVRYFARLREALGMSEETLPFDSSWRRVGDVRAALVARGGAWSAIAAPDVQCARNHEMVGLDAAVADGDEIAWFPPVTGG